MTLEQLSIFANKEIENYRNIQELNHRQVFFYDHKLCTAPSLDIPATESSAGNHYEKIKRNVYFHVFVPGQHPSGIPGSFVESKNDALGIKEDKNKKQN